MMPPCIIRKTNTEYTASRGRQGAGKGRHVGQPSRLPIAASSTGKRDACPTGAPSHAHGAGHAPDERGRRHRGDRPGLGDAGARSLQGERVVRGHVRLSAVVIRAPASGIAIRPRASVKSSSVTPVTGRVNVTANVVTGRPAAVHYTVVAPRRIDEPRPHGVDGVPRRHVDGEPRLLDAQRMARGPVPDHVAEDLQSVVGPGRSTRPRASAAWPRRSAATGSRSRRG